MEVGGSPGLPLLTLPLLGHVLIFILIILAFIILILIQIAVAVLAYTTRACMHERMAVCSQQQQSAIGAQQFCLQVHTAGTAVAGTAAAGTVVEDDDDDLAEHMCGRGVGWHVMR